MYPSRTTFSIVRSWSSSQVASVGVLAIVGVTERSMRSITPASSMPRNISSGVAAPAAISRMFAAMPMKTAGFGWTMARLSIHGSRGRTQQIASGSTPRSSSQMHGIRRGLARADDDVLRRRGVEPDQLVDGPIVRPRRTCRTAAASGPGSEGEK